MDEDLVEELAKFWMEWTDDDAPMGMPVYRAAARSFLAKYEVTKK